MKLKIFKDKSIKNIIFDLGNVVLDIDIMLTINEFNNIGIRGLKIEDIHPYQKDFFLQLELGTISDDDFLLKIRENYPESRNVSDEKIWQAWNKLLLDFDPQRVELLKHVGKNYNIYLLSNTNHYHRVYILDKFKKEFGYDFESLFERCYYSDVMNLRKPDPQIYSEVVEQSNLIASETLFIDDNYCNFSGAEEVGLNWYHLTGGEKITDLFK